MALVIQIRFAGPLLYYDSRIVLVKQPCVFACPPPNHPARSEPSLFFSQAAGSERALLEWVARARSLQAPLDLQHAPALTSGKEPEGPTPGLPGWPSCLLLPSYFFSSFFLPNRRRTCLKTVGPQAGTHPTPKPRRLPLFFFPGTRCLRQGVRIRPATPRRGVLLASTSVPLERPTRSGGPRGLAHLPGRRIPTRAVRRIGGGPKGAPDKAREAVVAPIPQRSESMRPKRRGTRWSGKGRAALSKKEVRELDERRLRGRHALPRRVG